MRKRIPIVLMALAFLLAPYLIREAQASPPKPACNTTVCRASCDTYCASKNSVCASVSVTTCGSACGVSGQCNFLCQSGSGLNQICYCPDCPPPAGSPIFRKQETKHSQPPRPETKPEAKPTSAPEPKPDPKPAPERPTVPCP